MAWAGSRGKLGFALAALCGCAASGSHADGSIAENGQGAGDDISAGADAVVSEDAGSDAETDADANGTCAAALGPAPSGPRRSSLQAGDCDYGELADYTYYDILCPPGEICPPPTQTGDQLCHRVCDDGLCAAGEQCEKRVIYVSDTPSRYASLCMCAASGCVPPAPPNPEGGLASWQADRPLPLDLYYHAAAGGAGRVFVSGGLTIDHVDLGRSSATLKAVDQILSATLDGGGRVTAWTSAGTLPAPLYQHAMAIAAGRLYLSGGGQRTFSATVTSAEISTDGTLGPWRAEAPMPTGRSWHRLLAEGGYLVVAGGSESPDFFTDGTTAVAVAALAADGVVGAWTRTFAPSPVFYDGGAGIARGRLYALGEDGILRSAPLPALDVWRPETTWHAIRSALAGMSPTDANMGPVNLFEQCGALVAILARGQTLTAPLDEAGVVGPWRIASRFHDANSGFAAAATPDGLYATGGARPPARDADVWSTRRR
ncbi:MAG: hypothetical protein ABJA82_02560 [Myxococcales bacterium]